MDNHPYTPDLLPCNYFRFPKMEVAMKETFYEYIPTIQAAATQLSKNIPINGMKEINLKLTDRSKQCVESNGDNFE